MKMANKYKIGGGWGDSIQWQHPERFMKEELTSESLFAVYGFKQKMPKIGDTLIGEFTKSYMHFVFTEVEPCTDPSDMFFATVRLTGQNLKDDKND